MSYMNSQDYLSYLIKNCGVRDYDFEPKIDVCARPDVEIILRYMNWLNLMPTDEVLEIGCGLGRILKEIHEVFQVNPYGIDPFNEVIEAANVRVGSFCKALKVSSAEHIDFPNQTFDKIICWGVFDLTNQTNALREMTRVLKKNGLLLLTGKSDCYEENDHEAMQAEKASIEKNIPNHYTNIDALTIWAKQLGLTILNHRRFKRRGDFINDQYCLTTEPQFYEYVFLLQRTHMFELENLEGPVVGKKNSDTFNKII